ncbi:MAG: Eco57I restriction-modification methylase domain-containing protein, partial [Sediminispirochaetaceae bacterium]
MLHVSFTDEFPEVFVEDGAGGFDVVLGNPPWEMVNLMEKEFFAGRAPEIADARTGA